MSRTHHTFRSVLTTVAAVTVALLGPLVVAQDTPEPDRTTTTQEDVQDPTQPSSALQDALRASGAGDTRPFVQGLTLPAMMIRGRLIVPGRVPVAAIEVNETIHLVREGSDFTVTLKDGLHVLLHIDQLTEAEIRIGSVATGEAIVLR